MLIRALDSTGDMQFGRGAKIFYKDDPVGVAQLVVSRLHLEEGQWYLDLSEGTPYMTQILGKGTASTRDPAIRARILETDGVSAIPPGGYFSVLDRDSRVWSVQTSLDTFYGLTDISTQNGSIVPPVYRTTEPEVQDDEELAPIIGYDNSRLLDHDDDKLYGDA